MSGPKDHLRGPQNSTWATHPSWQKVVDLTNSSQPSPAGTAAARERQVIPVVVSSSVEGMENEWKCVMTCHESRWIPMTSPIRSESSECPWRSVPWRTVSQSATAGIVVAQLGDLGSDFHRCPFEVLNFLQKVSIWQPCLILILTSVDFLHENQT